MQSGGLCCCPAMLLAVSFLLDQQRSCAQSWDLGTGKRVCDKDQHSLAQTQRRRRPGLIITWNATKAGENRISHRRPGVESAQLRAAL